MTPRLLHFGCGKRYVKGWHNVDLKCGDQHFDFRVIPLPLRSNYFDCVVSQHVIEHFDLPDGMRIAKDLYRCMVERGSLFISTPDMYKVCRDYCSGQAQRLLEDRLSRWPNWSKTRPANVPVQDIVNGFFHQNGQHKYLYDEELLVWLLTGAGFSSVSRIDETQFLARFPNFPARNDDYETLYMMAYK